MGLLDSLRALDDACGDWLADVEDDDPQRAAMLALRKKVTSAINLLETGSLVSDAAVLANYDTAVQGITAQAQGVAASIANLQKLSNTVGTVADAVGAIVTKLTGG
jgi:hypothetical protein